MQKSNGTYELVVWDDRPVGEATDTVTVNLGAFYPSILVYDITSGTRAIQVASNANSVRLALTDHALVVELRSGLVVRRTHIRQRAVGLGIRGHRNGFASRN